jgi:ribosomal protein S8
MKKEKTIKEQVLKRLGVLDVINMSKGKETTDIEIIDLTEQLTRKHLIEEIEKISLNHIIFDDNDRELPVICIPKLGWEEFKKKLTE